MRFGEGGSIPWIDYTTAIPLLPSMLMLMIVLMIVPIMLVIMLAHLRRRGIEPFLARNKLPPLRQKFNQRFRSQVLGGTGEESRLRPEPADDRLAQSLPGVGAARVQHHLHYLVTVDLSIVVHCHHFSIRTLPPHTSRCQPRTAKPLTSLKPVRSKK